MSSWDTKPNDSDDYLSDIVNKAEDVLLNRIVIQIKKINVIKKKCYVFCCDAPLHPLI